MEHISEESIGDQMDNQIIYRGEGNSSIVIALKDKAKVIRLLKKDGKIMKSSLDHHMSQHPMSSINFIHLTMRPLTYPFLTGPTQLVHLKSDFINMLSKQFEAERPIHRLDKTLHLDDQYALIMDDLCALPKALTIGMNLDQDLCGPTISVEIKPKQGFLPIYHLHRVMKPARNEPIASYLRDMCQYGLTQYLKLSRGRIQETSNYCPLNIFSGCPIRMRTALEELLNNPQNNLRIFKDLTLVYDEGNQIKLNILCKDFFADLKMGDNNGIRTADAKRQLINLLIQCLLKESTSSDNDSRNELSPIRRTEVVNATDENLYWNQSDNGLVCLRHKSIYKCRRCDKSLTLKRPKINNNNNKANVNEGSTIEEETFIQHSLPANCVLASVLRVQQLDNIGPHEACKMLDWLIANCNSLDVLDELSKPQVPEGFGSRQQLLGESLEKYYFRKVWEFLVSLTAKDCSIIVTMRRLKPGRYEELIRLRPSLRKYIVKNMETSASDYYLFNVGIADLDQKMPLKIHRICENLNSIVNQLLANSHQNELSNHHSNETEHSNLGIETTTSYCAHLNEARAKQMV